MVAWEFYNINHNISRGGDEMTDKYKISFEFHTVGSPDNMVGILKLCRQMGVLGASRKIGVKYEDGWMSYLFDGDGADKIENIKIEEIK